MPRFWLAPQYEPVLRDEDALAWQLRGSGVEALTEEGYVSASGEVVDRPGKEEPLARKWVETMTARYDELSAAAPVFGALRGCMDLAVVAALLTKEDLPGLAGCDLSLLLDEKQIAVAEYHAPKSIASQASVLKSGRGWIVSCRGRIPSGHHARRTGAGAAGFLARSACRIAPMRAPSGSRSPAASRLQPSR